MIAAAGVIRYGRRASATTAMPKPARPITKLAAVMTPAAAIHASVTRSWSVALRCGRLRRPPRVERRQVGARPEREPRRALFEEGGDTLAGVGGTAGPEHGHGIEAVRLPRRIGAQELPHHLPRQRDRDRGRGPPGLARPLAPAAQ